MSHLRVSRVDIEMRAGREVSRDDAMMLGASAPYVAYRYAHERAWITKAEHDQARTYYGNLWTYCGD